MKKLLLIIPFCLVSLVACEKKAKTIQYYKLHPEEARIKSDKCFKEMQPEERSLDVECDHSVRALMSIGADNLRKYIK